MKRVILCLLPFAFAGTAWACPNLTGKFDCSNEEKTENFRLNITQNAESVHWTIDDKDPQGPFPFKSAVQHEYLGNLLSYHVTCEGSSLILSGISQTVPQITAVKLEMKKTSEGLEIDNKNPLGYEIGSCKKVD